MKSYPDQHRASRFGSAAFAGLVVALLAVVIFKTLLGLAFVPSLVVACLAFVLTGSIALRQSVR